MCYLCDGFFEIISKKVYRKHASMHPNAPHVTVKFITLFRAENTLLILLNNMDIILKNVKHSK